MLPVKYFLPMIATGAGGICWAVNTSSWSVPAFNSGKIIESSQVQNLNNSSNGGFKYKDLTRKYEESLKKMGIYYI